MPVTRPAQLLRERGARPALTCGAAPSCQGSWCPGRQSPRGRSTQGSPTQPRPAFSLRAPPRHTSKPHKPLEGGGAPHRGAFCAAQVGRRRGVHADEVRTKRFRPRPPCPSRSGSLTRKEMCEGAGGQTPQRPAAEGANGSGQSPPTPGATARPRVKQTQVAPPQGTGAELAWALPTAAALQGWGETSAPLVAGTAEG